MFRYDVYLRELRKISLKKTIHRDVYLLRRGTKNEGILFFSDPTEIMKMNLGYDYDHFLKWQFKDDSDIFQELILFAIRKKWKEIPFLFGVQSNVAKLKMEERYKNDVMVFKPIKGSIRISSAFVRSKMSRRKCAYVHFPKNGLFAVGYSPIRLDCPDLDRVGEIHYSARIVGSEEAYKFVAEYQVVFKEDSSINLAYSSNGNIIWDKSTVLNERSTSVRPT